MASVLVRNNFEGDEPVTPPVHPDGSGYAYCMYLPGYTDVMFADSIEELLAGLLPGYPDMDEPEQAYQRIRLAQRAAAQVQAEVLAEVDPDSVSADEWRTLTAPRTVSQPRADWWTCPVPLVVVETGYEPFTDVPRPASGLADGRADAENLWWVRPAEDEDFLISLHEVGYLRLLANTEL